MRGYNSTIKIKEKICSSCGKPCFWFSKKRCKDCARQESAKDEVETEEGESMAYLIDDLDTICSLIVRMSAADKDGFVRCYTCATRMRWQDSQAGHYMSRKNMFLRWDYQRQIRVQCPGCNVGKHGNLAEFGKRLEIENHGITEILLEESRIIQKWSREELRAMAIEFNQKLSILKTKNN